MIFLLLTLWTAIAQASLPVYPIQGPTHVCPICSGAKKLKSRVYVDYCAKTAINCGDAYWDENGNIIFPDACNTATCAYHCSQGYHWIEEGNVL